MESPTYIKSLTPLRGLAALWVVLFHIDVSLYYRELGGLLSRDASGLFAKGYLWVDFFFLLSGFIIAHVYGNSLAGQHKTQAARQYLWARFTRLYPLHLFTLLVLVVASTLVAYWLPQVIDGSWQTYFAWSALPSHLLFTNAMNQHVYLSWNMVSWSIGAEWWTYVAAIGVLAFVPARVLGYWLLLMLCGALGLVALVYSLPEKNLDITFNYGFVRCLCEFVIGLGLYRIYQQRLLLQWLARDSLILVLLLLILIIFHWRLPDLLVVPVFCTLILAAAYNQTRVAKFLNLRWLQYLGDISYSVYLVHGIWFMVFWFAFPFLKSHLGGELLSPLWAWLYAVVFVLLTLGSAHLTHRYIELAGRRCLNRLAEYLPSRALKPQ